ncbi:hypothetical protein IV203_014146 [Nitzschia inconspicua]|uniref:Uncharacterized protein n=1 Tax=Nitzschia inconspicua TaxID=303405 RepID=A0A9K3M830_9STRA|nr:hypothetical protein IV203_014146 [Nitzschia inconspicua]
MSPSLSAPSSANRLVQDEPKTFIFASSIGSGESTNISCSDRPTEWVISQCSNSPSTLCTNPSPTSSAMQVLPSVSIEQGDIVESTVREEFNSFRGKKRGRDDKVCLDNKRSTRQASRHPSVDKEDVTTASSSIISTLSSGKRRSPRQHRRKGELAAEVKVQLALDTTVEELGGETTESLQTPTTTCSFSSTCIQQPLFSNLLAPHQQHSIFSPGALRTPHKSATSSIAAKSSSTPRISPSSILRKTTPIQARAAAATATNISHQQQLLESDPVATNLSNTMEQNVDSVRTIGRMDTAITTETQTFLDDSETTTLLPATSNTSATIDVKELQYRLSLLFPSEKYPQMQSKACILPRIIASYTFHKDMLDDEQHRLTSSEVSSCNSGVEVTKSAPVIATRRRKRSMDSKTHAIQRIQPIRPFLDALVDLEWNLLEESDQPKESKPMASSKPGKKRVHFAAFDGSTLRPPTDVMEGSQHQQEICIRCLRIVLDTVNDMASALYDERHHRTDQNDGQNGILAALQDLVSYLDQDFRLQYHDKTCAQSILISSSSGNIWYPTRRIEKAAALYSRDLESVIHVLEFANSSRLSSINAISSLSDSSPCTPCPLLSWECRLADVSSQLVRYWLRTLLNPVPGRANAKDKTERWTSRIAEIVTLVENTEKSFLGEISSNSDNDADSAVSSTAVEDGSLSSLLSDALSHVYDYLGGIPFENGRVETIGLVSASGEVWRERLLLVMPTDKCLSSELCSRGIGTGRNAAPFLSDQQWKQVGEELQVASDFVAFYHRVVFLEQLLSILLRAGDWASHWEETVQTAARGLIDLESKQLPRSNDCGTAILQQEDAHLVLLGIPLRELLCRIQVGLMPLASERYHLVKSNLQKTVAAFRFGKSNTKHKKLYQPRLGELEDYWNELLHGIVFPSVAPLAPDENSK